MAEQKSTQSAVSKRSALLTRRDALTIMGVTGVTAIASQLVTSNPLQTGQMQSEPQATHGENGNSSQKWQMVIDLNQCIGCNYCVWACQATNDVPDDAMRWNVGFAEKTGNGDDFYMTRPCLHCDEAPCVKVCPVGATWKRADGIVAMNYDRCIGCRYCEVACPYDARRFNWRVSTEANPYQPAWGEAEVDRRPRGVVEKCTFCVQRIDRGLSNGLMPGVDRAATPACVNACPVGARIFGDSNDPESPVSTYLTGHATIRLREDFGTEPNVHYVMPENEG